MGHRKNSPHKHPLQWYADLYKIPFQTIRMAHQRGWPLDDPAKLLKKFIDAPGPKTTLGTLSEIVNGEASQKQSKGERSDPEDVQDPPDIEGAVDESMVLRSGLLFELKRLQAETVKSYRNYLKERRPADKLVLQKVYLNNVAALRQLAKEAPKAEREAKNVLVIGDVEATWSRTLKECKVSLEMLGRRVSTNKMFAGLDPVDVEELINKEVVPILSHLESGSWLTEAARKE